MHLHKKQRKIRRSKHKKNTKFFLHRLCGVYATYPCFWSVQAGNCRADAESHLRIWLINKNYCIRINVISFFLQVHSVRATPAFIPRKYPVVGMQALSSLEVA
mmetsp:Transcript_672/g.4378  ORF Transcript_672/g.4378 Transcript_672/m.4378 type:complete len:103 (-) Transcript_672:61-369(-)